MISSDLGFHGFSAETWTNLLSLVGYNHPAYSRRRPTLVIVEDADGAAIAAFRTDRGALRLAHYRGRDELAQLCWEQGCRNAIVVQEGALETLAERAASQMPLAGSYIQQWLAVFAALRRAEDEGTIHYWPPRPALPVPRTGMVERAIDLVLPRGTAAVLAAWEAGRLWTAVALRRRDSEIDTIAGPGTIQQWTGPLSGDHRRDHRAIRQAVDANLAPMHLGLYALRHDLERLLRASEPGAWLQAVALRELVLNPAPPYAGIALGADAARAVAHTTRGFLGGLDLFAHVEPLVSRAREHLGQASSMTHLLGFNPLERLAERLQRGDRE
ncbi:MAG: hypothetical protein OXU20_28150 [Myxococcales bacterium]|nr:hypothetical protein [Myxococcales bacterium]MDD9967888.1 hypothetical protein [Myxococcales bacterium]